jgi:hypothetical protein
MKTIKIIIAGFIAIFVILGIVFIYQFFSTNSKKDNQINVTIDKTVIVQKVRSLNRLETVEVVIQRDLSVELDLGKVDLFGLTSFESKRTQKIAVTGNVVAGIDLSKIDADKVKFDENNNSLEIELPAPEILNISINEDKTAVLKDDLTALYRLQTLDASKRKDLNQELQKQVIKQSREALRDGACGDNVLNKAGQNGTNSIANLFAFANITTVKITYVVADSCNFSL